MHLFAGLDRWPPLDLAYYFQVPDGEMRQTKPGGAKQKARLRECHRSFHRLGSRRGAFLCPHHPAISVAETKDSAGHRQRQDQRTRHRRRGDEKTNGARETGVGRTSLNFF